MLEATQRRNVQASSIGSGPQDRQRRRLLVAIVLLLSTVILILAKDREFWFGGEEASAAEDVQPVAAVSTTAQVPTVPAQTTNPIATKPATKSAPERAASQANVVARSKHNSAPGSALRSSPSERTPATAAESVQTASARVPVVDSAYPMLTGQTSVQGSVLMEALIAANGAVEDLRVLSGPTILVSAARDAVRQWRFKPYLQNGKPVETSARVTVNFTIKVSNNVARYQPTSITSDGAL